MFRNEKSAENALLGWSMLDNDDAATLDIKEFDECSPLPRLSADLNHGYISESLSGSSPILKQQKSKNLQKATIARLPGRSVEPAPGDVPEVAVPVSSKASEQNSALRATNCVTSDWRTRVAQISACGQSARKKRRNALDYQCFIDESSSSDDSTADRCRVKVRTAGTCTAVEEVTEDELHNSADHPRMSGMGAVSSTLQDSDCSTDTSVGDAENTSPKQDVVKNGFEELLLTARQKEASELALWECYKKNANFPKTSSQEAEALTARVLTLENVYGLAYCACEVVSPENATSNVCVTLPLECAEREHLGSGVVVRIYPPWREYGVPSCREKVISGVQFFKVLKRPSSDTAA